MTEDHLLAILYFLLIQLWIIFHLIGIKAGLHRLMWPLFPTVNKSFSLVNSINFILSLNKGKRKEKH